MRRKLKCRNPLTGLNPLQPRAILALRPEGSPESRNPLTGLNPLQRKVLRSVFFGLGAASQSPYGAQSLATEALSDPEAAPLALCRNPLTGLNPLQLSPKEGSLRGS